MAIAQLKFTTKPDDTEVCITLIDPNALHPPVEVCQKAEGGVTTFSAGLFAYHWTAHKEGYKSQSGEIPIVQSGQQVLVDIALVPESPTESFDKLTPGMVTMGVLGALAVAVGLAGRK